MVTVTFDRISPSFQLSFPVCKQFSPYQIIQKTGKLFGLKCYEYGCDKIIFFLSEYVNFSQNLKCEVKKNLRIRTRNVFLAHP